MRSLRLACFFSMLVSTNLFAQSHSILVNSFPAAKPRQPIGLLQSDPASQGKIVQDYGKLPLSFEANQGQTDARVRFLSRGSGYTLFLTGDEAVFNLRGRKSKDDASGVSRQLRPSPAVPTNDAVLRMKLVKANRAAKATGLNELAGTNNYFIGNDPAKWRTNVPTYEKVKYEGIYSGIDLVYYGNQRQLEYDFIVAPGANPRCIQFDVRGAKRIRRDEHGDLVLKMGEGEIRWHKPVVYQEQDGTRQEIAARYAITDKNRVAFEVAKYDASRPLYIDPLIYSTYLGGSSYDSGYGIAVDSSGNTYVTGQTLSTNFPTMNPLQPTNGGGSSGHANVFVTKINPRGSALVYSTYLGGSGNDVGDGIAVDSSGNTYVTGLTESTNFPTMNPLQPAYGGGATDAFVTKINAMGSALVYSTYLGGSDWDIGSGIAVDSSDNTYVTGYTMSSNFPTMNPLQPANAGSYDTFVAKLNPEGSALVYSTYLGGSNDDLANGIAVDSLGNAYVAGSTASTNFPITPGAFQTVCGGTCNNAFVATLNPTGSALVYSTYLGGSGNDVGRGLAVDSLGNAYVTGSTTSTNFPITPGAFQTVCNGGSGCNTYGDAFVSKFNPTGSALVYSTYLGGTLQDQGYGIAVDSEGDAYVTGETLSTDFPTMNPLQPANGGGWDAFVTEFNPSGSALVYSTYLGGSGQDVGQAIVVDSLGNAYVTGFTGSTNFPTMNPLQPVYGGGQYDAFVSKIAPISPYNAFVQPPINADGSSIFRANRGVVPVKFTLTQNGTPTCALPLATISVTRTAGGTPGAIDETTYSMAADSGSNFRIDPTACQYIYNLAAQSLGVGTYSVDITINGSVVGSAVFALK